MRVRTPAVADEAVMASGPTGQVPVQHPPLPSPLQLVLHLETKPMWLVPQSTGADRLTPSHLSVDEAVQQSHHEALKDERRESVRLTPHTHSQTHTHTCPF